ncbi:MAG: hypothetical protein KC613_03100, partial [Myxococcales bacterium]|nr:hypothetical protein [Myxococcales bacterium]
MVDEDARPRASRCGVGACAREGTARCVQGAFVDDCRPGAPAARDATCDGVDDDCDGQVDEDAAPQPITCGVGLCRAAGERACVAGAWLDRCAPRAPLGDDGTCDGRDDDCDGVADDRDLDGDGALEPDCGGDDCDDQSAVAYPGS